MTLYKKQYILDLSNKAQAWLPGESEEDMRRMKRKTIWAYLDGEKLIDVVQAALDNNMMADDLKEALIKENPGHEVTFKYQ